MVKLGQVLTVGLLFSVISLSSAQAKDCSGFTDDMKEFQDTSVALDREQASYESNASDEQRHVVCHAIQNNISALIGVQADASADCLADPSKYQEGVDAMASELDDLTKMEALMCDQNE